MANQLKMAQIQSILTLHARGWSYRRIGRALGVHRETVKRYVELSKAACGDGSEVSDPPTQNRPNPPAGYSGPASKCEPFREQITQALEKGLRKQRIWQDLKTEHDFDGGYDCLKRFARRLAVSTDLPFRRMECAPGAEAQIDFGTGAPVVIPEGEPAPVGVKSRRRKTHVLRVVLSHSRKAYSEVV
ncbi:MAG: helix-turn-helix domain-containing protein [Phycisphaerae bacterium]